MDNSIYIITETFKKAMNLFGFQISTLQYARNDTLSTNAMYSYLLQIVEKEYFIFKN